MRPLRLFSRIFAGLGVALIVTGCGSPAPRQMSAAFNENDYAAYVGSGSATLTGQAFLKTRGGEVRYAAGSKVDLLPATAYTMEIVKAAEAGGKLQVDPRWSKYIRSSVGDGQGNFEFKNVPPGRYWIEVPIFWEVAGAYGMSKTGGIIRQEVTLPPNQVHKVILTK